MKLEGQKMSVEVEESGHAYIHADELIIGPLDVDRVRWLQAAALPAAIGEMARIEKTALPEPPEGPACLRLLLSSSLPNLKEQR